MRTGIILFLILFAFGCDEEDSNGETKILNYHNITGIYTRDKDGSNFKKVGNPNVDIIDTLDWQNDSTGYWEMRFYPNPTEDTIRVDIEAYDNSSRMVVWLEPAIYTGPDSLFDVTFYEGSLLDRNNINPKYEPNEKIYIYDHRLNQGGNFTLFNLSDIKPGFFKFYVEVNGENLFHDNIWIGRKI